LLEALRGPESLKVGVIVDQFGSFLALSTAGVCVAAFMANRKPSARAVALRIVRFPPFVAAVLGLSLRGVHLPGALIGAFERVGDTLTPLALISVGLSLEFRGREVRRLAGPLFAGLIFKLCLAPLGILALYGGVFELRGNVGSVSVLEAAMAPMITSAVLAAEEGLAPELASLLVGIGIPLSLLTVPIWNRLIGALG
jgi:predicted permease